MGIGQGEIINEHFIGCDVLPGVRHYEKGHEGVVLEDKVVEAGFAVSIFGADRVKHMVNGGVIVPCVYDLGGGSSEKGYVFGGKEDAVMLFGEVLECVD